MRKGLVLLLMLAPSAAWAGPAERTLEGLMERLRKVPGISASFQEQKFISLLATPLTSEGTLYFLPPGKLLRKTERPRPSAILIDQDRLYMRQGDSMQEVDLGANPVVRAFVGSFLKLFQGDRAALEAMYEVRFSSKEQGWELTLVPRSAPINKIIKRMRFAGKGVAVEKLEIDEMNGDRSVTTFSKVNAQRTFKKAEREELFRVDGK